MRKTMMLVSAMVWAIAVSGNAAQKTHEVVVKVFEGGRWQDSHLRFSPEVVGAQVDFRCPRPTTGSRAKAYVEGFWINRNPHPVRVVVRSAEVKPQDLPRMTELSLLERPDGRSPVSPVKPLVLGAGGWLHRLYDVPLPNNPGAFMATGSKVGVTFVLDLAREGVRKGVLRLAKVKFPLANVLVWLPR